MDDFEMAIYHLNAHVVSRGKGQSAIAKAAYNAREKLTDERTGHAKDYTRFEGLMFSGIFTPKDAPEWAKDRQQLWNAVEHREDKSNRPGDAQLTREIRVALPHELTDQQREWLVKDFVREQLTRKGMVADVAIHQPGGEGDDRNHHAHILVSLRSIGENGFGPKVREWNSKEQLQTWREKWELLSNKHLERHGHDARIDRRTLEAQGIEREPTTHRGPHVDAIERRGVEAENTQQNEARAADLASLKAELSTVQRGIAAEEITRSAEPEISAPANDNQIDLKHAAAERRAHFERMLTDENYRRDYNQKQQELEAREILRQRAEVKAQSENIPDWARRGGMEAQQDAANDYARRVEEHEKAKKLADADRASGKEQLTDAAPTDETKERRREAKERREKPSLEDVIEDLRSGGHGRDYRQR